MVMDEQQQQQQAWDWELLVSDDDDEFLVLEGGRPRMTMSMPMVVYTRPDYFICPPAPHEEVDSESPGGRLMMTQIHPPLNMNIKSDQDPLISIDQFVVDSASTPAVLPRIEAANFQPPGEKLGMVGGSIWKWGLNGIGAICSFGLATLCVVFFSTQDKLNHQRIKINNHHAIAAGYGYGGGVPITTAHMIKTTKK